MKYLLFFLFTLVYGVCFGQKSLQLKTAVGHPMQYYISLPNGYTKSKSWPVVFVLEAAEKEFEKNTLRFIDARGDMPFILVAPINTNNGNQGRKDPMVFPYSKETWDYIDKVGDCKFNLEGIHQIMLDIKKEFNGDEKIFITGFEAGTHDLWSVVFNHPEYLKAAAPVAGNFRNRCISSANNSNDELKKNLPIMSFVGEKDEAFGPSGILYSQWLDVKKFALSNGFETISETIIPEGGHTPLPQQVLFYFNSLSK